MVSPWREIPIKRRVSLLSRRIEWVVTDVTFRRRPPRFVRRGARSLLECVSRNNSDQAAADSVKPAVKVVEARPEGNS